MKPWRAGSVEVFTQNAEQRGEQRRLQSHHASVGVSVASSVFPVRRKVKLSRWSLNTHRLHFLSVKTLPVPARPLLPSMHCSSAVCQVVVMSQWQTGVRDRWKAPSCCLKVFVLFRSWIFYNKVIHMISLFTSCAHVQVQHWVIDTWSNNKSNRWDNQ